METAEHEMADRSEELSELKSISVKERFKEKTEPDSDELDPNRKSLLDQEPVDMSCTCTEIFSFINYYFARSIRVDISWSVSSA